jgi:putative peptidoglycan lipid II flippase
LGLLDRLQVLLLSRRIGGLDGRRLASTAGRVLVAAAVMAVTVESVSRLMLLLLTGGGLIQQALRLTITIVSGLVMLAAAAKMLRISEAEELLLEARNRLRDAFGR